MAAASHLHAIVLDYEAYANLQLASRPNYTLITRSFKHKRILLKISKEKQELFSIDFRRHLTALNRCHKN